MHSRHGLQRVQPGSASGTQSQEAWHRHKLKKRIGSLRQSLDALLKCLGEFTQSRLKDLQATEGELPDVPIEPFPDKHVLFDTPWLTAQGRSCADQYHRTKSYDVWSDEIGTSYYAMPRTLATYDKRAETWSRTPTPDDLVERVPPGTAKALASLFQAREVDCLHSALRALGLGDEPLQDLNSLLKGLSRYVLVVHGDAAQQYWRKGPQKGAANPHVQILCAFCDIFCMHASCEHVHAALVHSKHISLKKANMPDRGKQSKAPLAQQDPIPILLPAASHCSKRQSPPAPMRSTPDQCLKRLRTFLAANELTSWSAPLEAERFTVEQLAAISLPDLRAILQQIPAGILLTLKNAAAAWVDKAG